MSDPKNTQALDEHDELYADYWHVNTGDKTIHAKRMGGRWRNIKWLTSAVWLAFFLGPYLRWDGRQAVLFDIPDRQFHIFGLAIFPQDFWMLSLVLLFFAILLAVVTTLAGRVYCGFFCFQTVWTDVYTWIEDRLEGPPAKRVKLDQAPLDFTKFRIKFVKHLAWLAIAALTGVHFAAWFVDVFQLWKGYFTLTAPNVAWIVLGLFTAGTYFLAGFMREQACFWLCPYARIQGVMLDPETVLPAYDFGRGEPRGRVKKGQDRGESGLGDCVDCGQCVAVCPTGIDIRHGQQEGCITCALCIDACDVVMDKIGRPRGLIRYASLDELEGGDTQPLLKRPRVLVYLVILSAAVVGIAYGIANISSIDLKVLHERQPLFVPLKDGSIQNKYVLKVMNKTSKDLSLALTAVGPEGLTLVGGDEGFAATHGKVNELTVFVRVPRAKLREEMTPLTFKVEAENAPDVTSSYQSVFVGPAR